MCIAPNEKRAARSGPKGPADADLEARLLYLYLCLYIYIYRERERDVDIHKYIYIYIRPSRPADEDLETQRRRLVRGDAYYDYYCFLLLLLYVLML